MKSRPVVGETLDGCVAGWSVSDPSDSSESVGAGQLGSPGESGSPGDSGATGTADIPGIGNACAPLNIPDATNAPTVIVAAITRSFRTPNTFINHPLLFHDRME